VTLPELLDKLEAHYGRPEPPETVDPLEMILWENVVYLAVDDVRSKAFRALRKETGLRPERILKTVRARLVAISSLGGIVPEQAADKVRDVAEIAVDEFGGNLKAVLQLPLKKALSALKKFPGIGDPGAEKILLFSGTHPFLALESNALRTLLRLGYGSEEKGYAASYRSAQAAAEPECPKDVAWRIRAYQLLRRHGQELCKRSDPLCEECPLFRDCPLPRKEGLLAGPLPRTSTPAVPFIEGVATILVSDLERSYRFYTGTLGLQRGPVHEGEWAELHAPGVRIGLHPVRRGRSRRAPSRGVSIGFQVEDLAARKKELSARGVTFKSSGGLELFADPDGTPLYLAECPRNSAAPP
jgi:endonuclease-3